MRNLKVFVLSLLLILSMAASSDDGCKSLLHSNLLDIKSVMLELESDLKKKKPVEEERLARFKKKVLALVRGTISNNCEKGSSTSIFCMLDNPTDEELSALFGIPDPEVLFMAYQDGELKEKLKNVRNIVTNLETLITKPKYSKLIAGLFQLHKEKKLEPLGFFLNKGNVFIANLLKGDPKTFKRTAEKLFQGFSNGTITPRKLASIADKSLTIDSLPFILPKSFEAGICLPPKWINDVKKEAYLSGHFEEHPYEGKKALLLRQVYESYDPAGAKSFKPIPIDDAFEGPSIESIVAPPTSGRLRGK